MNENKLREAIRKELKNVNESHEAEIVQGFNAAAIDPTMLHSLIMYTLAGTTFGLVAKKIADTVISRMKTRTVSHVTPPKKITDIY